MINKKYKAKAIHPVKNSGYSGEFIFKVTQDLTTKMYYATSIHGCSGDYKTPELAIDSLIYAHASKRISDIEEI